MKTNAKSIIAFSALALGFLTFKKADATVRTSAVRSIVTQGKWKVNLYRDNGVDETNNYTGYVFEFSPDGTVVARKEDNLLSGTWRSEFENRKTKLYLEFASASHLNELTEDWQIIQKNKNTIELEDTAAGDGGIDYLNFQKIS